MSANAFRCVAIWALVVVAEGEAGQVVGQGGEGGRDVAEQFQGRLVVVVDVGGNRVDVHDGALDVVVPLHRVVFDGVVSDGDQDVGVVEDDIAGLVAEQPHPAEEVVLERAGHHPGGLEGFHDGQPGRGDQGAQRRAAVRVGAAHTDQQGRPARGADQLARLGRRRAPGRPPTAGSAAGP